MRVAAKEATNPVLLAAELATQEQHRLQTTRQQVPETQPKATGRTVKRSEALDIPEEPIIKPAVSLSDKPVNRQSKILAQVKPSEAPLQARIETPETVRLPKTETDANMAIQPWPEEPMKLIVRAVQEGQRADGQAFVSVAGTLHAVFENTEMQDSPEANWLEPSLSPSPEANPRHEITLQIGESLQLAKQQVGQVEVLVAAMPDIVQESIANFLVTSDPEAVETVEELIVTIAQAADRLHELSISDQTESEEAIEVEALLREWYEELLATIGVEPEEEEVERFIAFVRSGQYKPIEALTAEEALEEGTHEQKYGFFSLAHDFTSSITGQVHSKLGKFTVGVVTA